MREEFRMTATAISAAGGRASARRSRGPRRPSRHRPQAPLDRSIGEPQALPAEHRRPRSRALSCSTAVTVACHSEWSISMSSRQSGYARSRYTVRPFGSTTGCCWTAGGRPRRRAPPGTRARARTSSAGRPLGEVGETLPRRRSSAAPTAQVVVHLAELGVGAEALVADVLDHRQVAVLVEDATEIEHRARHRRDPRRRRRGRRRGGRASGCCSGRRHGDRRRACRAAP